jgi:hypothetical protein
MTARITKSSGNVYADLGVENPSEHALKAEFVRRISREMRVRPAAVASINDQVDVVRMLRGHFRHISVAKLRRCHQMALRSHCEAGD